MAKRESSVPNWLRFDIFECLMVVLTAVVLSIIIYSILSVIFAEPNPVRWFWLLRR